METAQPAPRSVDYAEFLKLHSEAEALEKATIPIKMEAAALSILIDAFRSQSLLHIIDPYTYESKLAQMEKDLASLMMKGAQLDLDAMKLRVGVKIA